MGGFLSTKNTQDINSHYSQGCPISIKNAAFLISADPPTTTSHTETTLLNLMGQDIKLLVMPYRDVSAA